MSRLIDADKFLDFIKSELKQDRTDEKHLENIICVLENLPTVYDVDKVARQLEKECVKHRINVAETNFCPPPRIINEYDYGISEGIMRAIEIVKAGEV